MLATAQHVRQGPNEGWSTFIAVHPGVSWTGWPPFTPEQNPGVLVHRFVRFQGPARVRSYLDLVAPDTTDPDTIRQAFEVLFARAGNHPRFPGGAQVGMVWFRFDREPALHLHARQELRQLFEALEPALDHHWRED